MQVAECGTTIWKMLMDSLATIGNHSHRLTSAKLRTRRKRHLAWEQAELASGGLYPRYLDEIAHRYPELSLMERRVAALVRAMLPSWKIAEMLVIAEKTVENHRIKIRRKT